MLALLAGPLVLLRLTGLRLPRLLSASLIRTLLTGILRLSLPGTIAGLPLACLRARHRLAVGIVRADILRDMNALGGRGGGCSLPVLAGLILTLAAWLVLRLAIRIVASDLVVQFLRKTLQFFASAAESFRIVTKHRLGGRLNVLVELLNSCSCDALLLLRVVREPAP